MPMPALPHGEDSFGFRFGCSHDQVATYPRFGAEGRMDVDVLAPARGIINGLMLGCGAWTGIMLIAAASLRLL